MHMVKNNISFWGALIRHLSRLSPFHRYYCLAHGGKPVAWRSFWSLTWTHGKGKGCRCWLDVSFTLGDKLLCEQAILDFQGHRMDLRDCQRSTFMLLFTLKNNQYENYTVFLLCRLFENGEHSQKQMQSTMQRRHKSSFKLGIECDKHIITKALDIHLSVPLLFNNMKGMSGWKHLNIVLCWICISDNIWKKITWTITFFYVLWDWQ